MLVLTFGIVACNQSRQNSEAKVKLRKIDPVLTDIFQNKYANYKENALIKDKALAELTLKIDSLAPLHYFEDIPLKILKIKKNPYGIGALVQFYTDNLQFDKSINLSNNLQFDILGFMSEELATKLKDNKKYFIFGKKYDRLDDTQTYIIVSQTYFGPEVKISEDAIYTGTYTYKVGVFLTEIDSVRQVD